MRVIRSFLAVLVVLLTVAGTSRPVVAQDDGVDFADLPGLQSAVTRTFTGATPSEPQVGAVPDLRDHLRPEIALLLVGIFAFDTEANARAGHELLQTDMNATGLSGQALPLTAISLPLDLEHAAGVAQDASVSPPVDFTLVLALDGTLVYTVIGITSGAPPETGMAEVTRSMAGTPVGSEPVIFNTNGASVGVLWDKIPTRDEVERRFRGIVGVSDAAPFPVT